MSFKDVQTLAEHLKLLGYPNHVPIGALYTVHGSVAVFKIVADILKWLVESLSLEHGFRLPSGGVSTEAERINFIKSTSELLMTKAGIRVNPRKLYSASVSSAGELLKITNVLIKAPVDFGNQDEEIGNNHSLDLSDKIETLRKIKELSSELTVRGASLYDLLGKETINKEVRDHQANRPMELATVERNLKLSISALQNKMQAKRAELEQSKYETANLNGRLQRKRQDLERNQQRLSALQKVRPSYLEEFEKLEEELKVLFQSYVVKHRTMDAIKMALAAKEGSNMPSPLISTLSRNEGGDGSMTVLPEGFLDDSEDDDADQADNDLMQLQEEIKLVSEAKSRDRPKSSVLVRPRIRTGGRKPTHEESLIDLKNTERFSESDDSDIDLTGVQRLAMKGASESDDDDDDDISAAMIKHESGSKTTRDISDEDF